MVTSIAKYADDKLIRAKQGINKSLPFFCPGCNQEVYAATEGKIQRPHFRHKSIGEKKGCSEHESYIHWITKELFAEYYQEATSFYLIMDVLKICVHKKYTSCKKTERVKINLKKIYPHIKVEKKIENFRPDCLIFNDNGEKLFFEVCYSSKVSEDKINSGFPIIELYTNDEKTIDTIIQVGELQYLNEISFQNRRPTHLPQTKIYNEDKLLLHIDTSFDCLEKCIIDEQKKYQREQVYYPPKKVYSPLRSIPIPIASPLMDSNAISYLSRYKSGYYAKEKAIPAVLRNSKEYYNNKYNKYKNQHISSKSPIILDEEEDVRLFIYYQEVFFGIVRYESYWHIFYDKDNKLIFISSIENKDDILNEIKIHMNIF